LLLVNLNSRNRSSLRTGGNDDILGLQSGLLSIQTINFDLVGGLEFTPALNIVDIVLLEKEFDTLGKTVDSLKLSLKHVVKVKLNIGNLDTTGLEFMSSLMVDVRVVQHGLGRDTTNVQASTTKGTTLLNTSNLIQVCQLSDFFHL
jgi:hypothetical protein